jgi:hypothetical protein
MRMHFRIALVAGGIVCAALALRAQQETLGSNPAAELKENPAATVSTQTPGGETAVEFMERIREEMAEMDQRLAVLRAGAGKIAPGMEKAIEAYVERQQVVRDRLAALVGMEPGRVPTAKNAVNAALRGLEDAFEHLTEQFEKERR